MAEIIGQYIKVRSRVNSNAEPIWIYRNDYGEELFNRRYNNRRYDSEVFDNKQILSGYKFEFIVGEGVSGSYDGPHHTIYLNFTNEPATSRGYYNRIKYYVEQFMPSTTRFIGIPFESVSGEFIYLNVDINNFIDYDTFTDRLQSLIDIVNDNGYDQVAENTTPEFSTFSINFGQDDAYVFGRMPSLTIYNLEDFTGNNNCFINSLKFLNIDNDTDDFSLQNYINILRLNNAPVKVVTNSGSLKQYKGRCKVSSRYIREDVLYEVENYKYVFLYDNEHICLTKGFKDLIADCKRRCFIDDEKHTYWNKNNPYFKNTVARSKCILAIDFEATYDKYYRTIPYSFSACIIDKCDLQNLVDEDNAKNAYDSEEFKDLELLKHIYEVGDENYLRGKIIEILNDKNFDYQIISFNGANYDFHILKKMMIEGKIKETMFMADSSILCGQIMYRHDILDVRKISGGSLDKCCTDYKIFNRKAKDLVSHDEIQNKFNSMNSVDFYDWVLNENSNKRYNDLDVVSLLVLYGKLNEVFSTTIKKDILWQSKCTISGISKEIFDYTVNSKKIQLSGLPQELYYKIKEDIPAGRVQCNTISVSTGEWNCPDACSLYPYVCQLMPVYFPCGKIISTDVYVEDKLGFYICDIDQSNLAIDKKIYCNKTKIENDWRYTDILENKCIDTPKIDLLRKYGCNVKIHRGWYFTDKVANYELFEEFTNFRNIKDAEDAKCGNERNGALREMMKAMMNCITGKLFQSIYEKTTVSITLKQWNEGKKISNNEREVRISNKVVNATFLYSVGEKVNVEVNSNIEKELEKSRIYIGAYIYSYSQIHMYESVLSKVNFDNTDTDSCHMSSSEFNKWLEYATTTNVPIWSHMNIKHPLYSEDSKIFGSFECELQKYKYNGKEIDLRRSTRYIAGKKMYMYINDNGYKMTFKGIGKNDKIVSTVIDDKVKNEESFKSDQLIRVGNNPKLFFDTLFNNKKVSVVGFSMERNKRTTLKNDAFDIIINYAPKTITLHKLDCRDKTDKCTCNN
jgi:hypothetical protein